MIRQIKHHIAVFFSTGHQRTIKAKKNILVMALIKVVSILISLFLVRLTIGYVDTARYGIWFTVSSIVVWFSFCDIGLSNGMRNKFAEAVEKGNHPLAKAYVSTTYLSLAIIFAALWLVFLWASTHINWCALLNIPDSNDAEILMLVSIVFSFFCLQFVLRIINTILLANQQPAKSSFIDMLGQLLSLLIIIVLIHTTQGSLIYLGLGLTLAPLLILLLANLCLFRGEYKQYAPSLSCCRFKYFKEIFGLSSKFFIIQIAAIIQYQTANFIIARYFSMESVTDYNIVYKYFNVLFMCFMILLTPFWSAATEAFAKKDFVWISHTVKRYNQLVIVFTGVGLIMLLASTFVYDLWLGKGMVSIPFQMSMWCLINVAVSMFGAIYVNLLNGIGVVKIQYYASLVTPFLFIGLCWLMIDRWHWGVYSLFIAFVVSNVNGVILAPLQYHKIFRQGKGGLWKA